MWLVMVMMEDMPIIRYKWLFETELEALRKAVELYQEDFSEVKVESITVGG
jgi:hypothetical protein